MLYGDESKAWDKACRKHTAKAYKRFASRFPNGTHAETARTKHEELEWNTTREKDTIQAYEGFLRQHPGGVHQEDATNRITKVTAQRQAIHDAVHVKDREGFTPVMLPEAQDQHQVLALLQKQSPDAATLQGSGSPGGIGDLFQGVPLTKLSAFKQEAADYRRRTASMLPGAAIASTTIVFSVCPRTPANAPTYSSFGEAFCLVRFDLDDRVYRCLCTAVREGKVAFTVKTYSYPTYPVMQFLVRIYPPTLPDPWWQEILGDVTDGNIQDFLIDACRLRQWNLIISRYDPPGEKALGQMIDPAQSAISLSEDQVAHFIRQARTATQHFLRIPGPQRDFLRAAQQFTQDNLPIEGI